MKYIVERLENGLCVVLLESHAAEVVAFQMWVNVGSADEGRGEFGVAHVFEHMLFKGTKRRKVGEIAREIESSGGYMNAWTSHDETVFHITMASRFKDRGLDILADAVMNATLNPAELKKELSVIREEIRMGNDSPHRAVVESLLGNVFRRSPYGRPVIGYDRTVKKLDSGIVRSFFERWYVPSNMVFVVCGDFDTRTMRDKVKAAFERFPRGDVPNRENQSPEPSQRKARFTHVTMPISECHLAVGFPIPGLVHEDGPAIDLLAGVLGQGASSRLETILRRRLGLASEIRAMAFTPRDAGVFAVFAMTSPDKLESACAAICSELARLFLEPISRSELRRARALLVSDSVYSEETVDGIGRKLGFHGLHTGDFEYERRYLDALARVDSETLRAVAQRYLSYSRINIAALVPEPSTFRFDRKLSWTTGRRNARKVDAQALRTSLQKGANKAWNSPVGTSGSHIPARPEAVIFELGQGDILIVREDSRSRLVAARAAFLGGAQSEPSRLGGISTLLSSSLVRGTETRSADHVSRAMDSLACQVAGFSGNNTFGVQGEFLSSNFSQGFCLMAECLRYPALLSEEIEREKEILIDGIRAARNNPGGQVFEALRSALFGKHPYGRPTMGDELIVSTIDAGALRRHLTATTAPGTMVLALVGGVDVNEAREIAEEHMTSNSAGRKRSLRNPRAWRPPSSPKSVVRSMQREQSHLAVGFPGARFMDEDRFALEVLVEILGGDGGRLFESIREKKALAYAVTAMSMEGIEPGFAALYAATSPGNEKSVIRAILNEVVLVRQRRPSAAELTRVKRYLIGARAIASQRGASRAASMSLGQLYGIGHDAADRYPARIEAVTQDTVLGAARRYLDPSRMVVACAGPQAEEIDLLAL